MKLSLTFGEIVPSLQPLEYSTARKYICTKFPKLSTVRSDAFEIARKRGGYGLMLFALIRKILTSDLHKSKECDISIIELPMSVFGLERSPKIAIVSFTLLKGF